MAKTKHGIFKDMNAMNMDDTTAMADKDQEKMQMKMTGMDKKASKPKKSM